jgi:hypothetical protein
VSLLNWEKWITVVMLYRWTRSTKNLHASLLSSVEVDFTFRS